MARRLRLPPRVARGCNPIFRPKRRQRALPMRPLVMNCNQLAARIETIQPDAMPSDVARLCLLLTNCVDNVDELADESRLTEAWQHMGIRLQAATDQHEAMTQELEDLARSDPKKFSPDQIWILLRAIKVQSQILQMYVGQPALDV
jgi:hypothetical protein